MQIRGCSRVPSSTQNVLYEFLPYLTINGHPLICRWGCPLYKPSANHDTYLIPSALLLGGIPILFLRQRYKEFEKNAMFFIIFFPFSLVIQEKALNLHPVNARIEHQGKRYPIFVQERNIRHGNGLFHVLIRILNIETFTRSAHRVDAHLFHSFKFKVKQNPPQA